MKVSKNDFQYMLECIERDLATILVEKRGMTIRQALSILYDSDTYRLLQNPNTGLYFQSPQYVNSYVVYNSRAKDQLIDKGISNNKIVERKEYYY